MSQLVVTNADKAEWEEIKNVNITIPTGSNPELQNEVKQIYVADKNGNNKIGIWDKYLQYDADGVVSERTDINKNEIEEFSMLTNYFGNSSKRLKKNICQNCQNLNKITINNNNNASNPLILEDGIFNGCKNTTSLIINCPVSSETTNAKFEQMPKLLTPVGSGSTVPAVTTYFNLKTNRDDLDYTVTAYSSANGPPFEGTKTGNIMADSVYNNGIMITLKNVATNANISSGTQPYIKNLQIMPHNTDKKEICNIDSCHYYYNYYCTVCEKLSGQSDTITNHNYQYETSQYNTATWEEYDLYTCSNCGDKIQSDVRQGKVDLYIGDELYDTYTEPHLKGYLPPPYADPYYDNRIILSFNFEAGKYYTPDQKVPTGYYYPTHSECQNSVLITESVSIKCNYDPYIYTITIPNTLAISLIEPCDKLTIEQISIEELILSQQQ